jgi:hypothetical protein
MDTSAMIIEILKEFWPRNKAKGLLAQAVFSQEIDAGKFGQDAKEKIVSGCWLLAPKETSFYKFRHCFFVHPSVIRTDNQHREPKNVLDQRYRPFHAIAEFMNNAGIRVIYVITQTKNGDLPFEEIRNRNFRNIKWQFFLFQNGNFIVTDPTKLFAEWGGGIGRPSRGTEWDQITETRMEELRRKKQEIISELFLNELFFTGFLKSVIRKSVNDPYDTDCFLISISQKHIFPMEIKEKFAGGNTGNEFFGIDAGRVLMLLRICLPNDANAIYLIRELDQAGNFIGWKYMTLSDIVMTSSWNLQAGGTGMGGQSTQTIRLPYTDFKYFKPDELSEDNLKKLGNLPKHVKSIAEDFRNELSQRFNQI